MLIQVVPSTVEALRRPGIGVASGVLHIVESGPSVERWRPVVKVYRYVTCTRSSEQST
jgi:hypothetical protein